MIFLLSAFANDFSTETYRPSLGRQTFLFDPQWREGNQIRFLKLLGKHGASAGREKQEEIGEAECVNSGAMHAFRNWEREHTGVDETRVILSQKEVAGEREGEGCIQPRDYHKEQIQKDQGGEMNFRCRKEISGFGHEEIVVVLQDTCVSPDLPHCLGWHI